MKASKYIKDKTKRCSDITHNNTHPQYGQTEETTLWITPDEAREAVKVAEKILSGKYANGLRKTQITILK